MQMNEKGILEGITSWSAMVLACFRLWSLETACVG